MFLLPLGNLFPFSFKSSRPERTSDGKGTDVLNTSVLLRNCCLCWVLPGKDSVLPCPGTPSSEKRDTVSSGKTVRLLVAHRIKPKLVGSLSLSPLSFL